MSGRAASSDALSAGGGGRHVESAGEGGVAAVLSNNLYLPFLSWHESECNHWISAQGDVRLHVEHLPAIIGGIDRADESRRCEISRDLIHLHAVEVWMPDHQLGLHGLARVEI